MPDKAWKKRERDVANYFNGQRTPLSGGNGKVTRADVIHDDLFIECKLRVKHTAVTLWDVSWRVSQVIERVCFHQIAVIKAFTNHSEGKFRTLSLGKVILKCILLFFV